MKNIIRQLLVFFVFVVSLNLAAQTLPVITGQVKCQGRGVANVVVTNGFDCVSTDVAGKYTIPYHRDARFVYVTTPAGYLPQRDGSLPLFYQRITKGTSVYDFSLVKNSKNDDKHLFLVQADVQLGKDEDVTAYSEYLRDVKEFVDKCSKYDLFMLDCGDIVGNALSLFSSYKKASDVLDVPMYRVIGNHDMEYGVRSYEHSYKSYEENFGPIYYSFNRGKAHYIVLDNCYYINRHYRYIGYIDERTLQWIEKDLAFVPKDHLVFVSMHIPSSSTKELEFNALLPDETSNASSLYDLLKGYEAHLLTGHTHNNGNVVFNDSLMEHNTAVVSETKSEWALLLQPGILKAVIIGVAIAILGQFMGVNAVLYYGPSIFEKAGLSGGDSLFYQVLVGLVNTLTTVLALAIIDRVGRKKLVYYGVSGMVLSLLFIGIYFLWEESLGLSSLFLLVCFLSYVFCCAVSICAVVFVLLSEMYPTKVRGLAMSIAGFSLWIGTYLIGQLTPWMLQNLTPAGTFFLFAAMCVPYMLIVWKLVPETTGKSLEEIERYWTRMK